jgi:benzil reductase ((S)-benzoin forming)
MILSDTRILEEIEKGNYLKMYSVSPGVIDTDMQNQIRQSGENDFSSRENFIAFYEKGELVSPKIISARIINLLELPYSDEVNYTVKN